MCGGGAKPPFVQKAISDYLSNAEVFNTIPPDEVIAIGAAKQVSLALRLKTLPSNFVPLRFYYNANTCVRTHMESY